MELFEVAHFLNLVSMVGFDCEDLRMLSFFFGLSTLIRQADYKKLPGFGGQVNHHFIEK